MKLVAGTDVAARAEDEAVLRVLTLAGRGWGLGDIATDTERDVLWVIETLYAHRDAFAPVDLN